MIRIKFIFGMKKSLKRFTFLRNLKILNFQMTLNIFMVLQKIIFINYLFCQVSINY